MLHSSSVFLLLVAPLISIVTSTPISQLPANDIATLCPELFKYTDRSKDGIWTGSLVVRYDEDLVGLWIRLVFDSDITDVKVDGFESVLQDGRNRDILIKNRDMILKADETRILNIAVKYEGSKVPSIIQYRLNARKMCFEEKILDENFFHGDSKSNSFLPSLIEKSKLSVKNSNKCGVRPSDNDSIYPWHASVFVEHDKEQFVCEATLIDQSHVLTAAHCVSSTQNTKPISRRAISVYLGGDYILKSAVRVNVSKIFIHNGYETGTIFNDLAILRLGEPLNINDNVRPICLNEGIYKKGSEILGYGDDIKQVQREKVVEISREECLKRVPELRNVLTDDNHCLSYTEGNRKCIGNSGSSFEFKNEDVTTLQGIITLSVKLQNKECNENSVVVVTDVSRYFRWIQHILNAVDI